MPGRDTSFGSANNYRYGFNGKENDNEVKGKGNQQDYGMRIYDLRASRFLSVDPLIKKYPWYTPYSFAGNKPIKFYDLDGAEEAEGEAEAREEIEEEFELQREREELHRNLKIPSAEEEARGKNRVVEFLKLPPEERARRNDNVLRGLRNYSQNVVTTAGLVFGNGNTTFNARIPAIQQLMRFNRANGEIWEDQVHNFILKNPNYSNVVKQVTLVVNGTMNGKAVSARIRIDNVGVRNNGTVDLYEAKYSVEEITVNNIRQTMTTNQKDAFDILLNGTNVSITFRGGIQKSLGTGFVNGQNINGKINSINIIAPIVSTNDVSNTTSSTTNGNSSQIQNNIPSPKQPVKQ